LIRVLLIPSSDYLGHPFPQRHNHIFERIHDGREFEVHVVRFGFFGKPRLSSRCVIHEVPLEFKTRSAALYYIANAASYTAEILRIVRAESIDVVVAGNLLPPLLYSLVQRLAELRVGFVFDLQDYYPTSAAGYIADVESATGKALTAFFEGITLLLVRSADAVTVPGVALSMYARRAGAKRVEIVPNGVSEHFFAEHDGGDVRRKLGFGEDDVVVGYVGSVEFWLDMEPLIRAAAVARRTANVKLLIVGKHLQTGYVRKVEEWIKRYGVQDITTWIDFVPHKEVPKYIAAMDVGTIPFNTANPTAFYAAPNKMWEYLSQGAAVASTPIPEALAYRQFVAIARSFEDYINVMQNAKKLREGLRHLKPEIKKLINARTWSRSAEKMKSIVREVSKRSGRIR